MSRHTSSARPGADRASFYDEITARIIAELEAGRVPRVQPWDSAASKAPLGMPRNAATGRPSSGINVLILWSAVSAQGFAGQNWLTFRQALALGGTWAEAVAILKSALADVASGRVDDGALQGFEGGQWRPLCSRSLVASAQSASRPVTIERRHISPAQICQKRMSE